MSKRKSKTNVDYGEFPFPLLEGPQESRFLTWVRNHSNYMASRGFLDYLRSVGVLVRGIVVNFLIFLPWLLLVSILLAPAHHWMLAHPFYLTFWTLGIAAAGIFLFMILLPLLRVFNYRRSLETGSESSIRWRDICERWFGAGLLLIGAAVTLDTLPWMLEFLRNVLDDEHLNSGATLTALTGALVLLSSSDKLLSRLGGVTKLLARGVIGILGVLVPLFVILFVNDILVYGAPPSPWVMLSPLIIPVFGVLVLVLAFYFGLSRQAFSRRDSRRVIAMIVGGLLVIACAIYLGSKATFNNIKKTEESLERLVAPLDTVAKEFANISPDAEIGAEVKDLVDQFVSVQREYGRAQADLKFLVQPGSRDDDGPDVPDGDGAKSSMPGGPDRMEEAKDRTGSEQDADHADFVSLSKWQELDTTATGLSEKFEIGREFVILGNELSALPRGSLDPLRDEVARLAHDRLSERLAPKVEVLAAISAEASDYVSTILREQFERELVKGAVRKLVAEWGQNYDPVADNDAFEEKMANDPNLHKVLGQYEFLFTDPLEALEYAPIYGENLLRERTTRELANLAGKKKIEDLFNRNFHKKKGWLELGVNSADPSAGGLTSGDPHWERKRELAKLTGIDGIAELVSKRDLIGKILSDLPGPESSGSPTSDSPIDEEIAELQAEIDAKKLIVEGFSKQGGDASTAGIQAKSLNARKELADLLTYLEQLKSKKIKQQSLEKLARISLIKLALPGKRPGSKEYRQLTLDQKSRVAIELVQLASVTVSGTEKYPDLALEEKRGDEQLAGQKQAKQMEHDKKLENLKTAAAEDLREVSEKVEKEEKDKQDQELERLEKSEIPEDQKEIQRTQLRLDTEKAITARKDAEKQKINDKLAEDTATLKTDFEEGAIEREAKLEEEKIAFKQYIEERAQERKDMVAMIPRLAHEKLANLVLEELDTNFLGVLALHPDLYRHSFDDLVDTFKRVDYQLDRPEFENRKALAEFANDATLETLVKHAFADPKTRGAVTEPFSEKEVGGSSFSDVAKLLLAQRAILDIAKPFDELALRDDERTSLQEYHPHLVRSLGLTKLGTLARKKLAERALHFDPLSEPESDRAREAREVLGKLYESERLTNTDVFDDSELTRIAVTRFIEPSSAVSDDLVSTMMFGRFGPLERETLGSVKAELSGYVMWPKIIFFAVLAAAIGIGGWLTIDVNLTSIHGLYRDRLASAFLVGEDTEGDVDIEEDVDLEEICRHEARSIAPYHLVNVALNLQGSDDPGIRDRNSDFFILSKQFIGGDRTGYCRSETMERVFPQMSLSTAMAISAAAASPNMGRGTSPITVAFMTLLNIRMGFWLPNPGQLEQRRFNAGWLSRLRKSRFEKFVKQAMKDVPFLESDDLADEEEGALGFAFNEVFARELEDIEKRWCRVDPAGAERNRDKESPGPTVRHGLVGIAFSGGGIRSAAINLGITQALHKCGIFGHADYMSTVSGGGYLGSSISALMRTRTKLESEIAGTVHVETEGRLSEIGGIVKVERDKCTGDQVVRVASEELQQEIVYRFSPDAKLAVSDGDQIAKATRLIHFRDTEDEDGEDSESLSYQTEDDEERDFVQITGDQVVTIKPTGQEKAKSYWFSPDAKLDVKDDVKAGKLLLKPRGAENISEISGSVAVSKMPDAPWEQVVTVTGAGVDGQKSVVYRFSRFEKLMVETGEMVTAGQPLIDPYNTLGARFQWRVRPTALLREITSRLDEKSRWVNLSDGGHLENLATIELLRRRCKFIIIGDGEADPLLNFNGLATLIRTAQIDLGIEIKINLDAIRLRKVEKRDAERTVSAEHWAVGTIRYPKIVKEGETEKEGLSEEVGRLLYLKSSFTGDENEVVQEYRRRNPSFPHQTTADQSFDEGQFEAYRALGEHIAKRALDPTARPGEDPDLRTIAYGEMDSWFDQLTAAQKNWRNSKGKAKPDTQGGRISTGNDKKTDDADKKKKKKKADGKKADGKKADGKKADGKKADGTG